MKEVKKNTQELGIYLNKYIAHAGICSRRDAVELIKKGEIKVNNKIELEPYYLVTSKDKVFWKEKQLTKKVKYVYILLNKPKDYLTTTDDPQGRKTVLDLIRRATTERVYPVGRLDRNSLGLLLITNDGELTQKLSHPSHQTKKVYQVQLDKALKKEDFVRIQEGIILEDGKIKVDEIAYLDSRDNKNIGIEIHSGKNRIIRRLFEHLNYQVLKLDRVYFAGLTKKNLPRGKWRFLSDKEVSQLYAQK